jgi:hypothetical protein
MPLASETGAEQWRDRVRVHTGGGKESAEEHAGGRGRWLPTTARRPHRSPG